MAGLLCACYSITLRDRYTGAEVEGCDLSLVNITEGNYTRDLDATSTSYAKYDAPGLGCCECKPEAWQHIVSVERTDGNETETVWEGVVTNFIEDRVFGTFELFASDKSILWTRQPYATRDLFFPKGTDEADVWAALVSMAEECAQTGLAINPTSTGCGIGQDRFITKGEDVTSLISSLSSVHWSVVAGKLLGPGPNLQGTQTRNNLSTDVDWENNGAVIDNDGTTTVTHATVSNQPPDGTGPIFTGAWPTDEPQPQQGVGCHAIRIVDPKIESNAQARDEARLIVEQRRNGNRAIVTSAGSLSRDSELCISDLIPDRRVSIETTGTCSDFVDDAKINRVVVRFATSSELGQRCITEKQVAPDFIPVNGVASTTRNSV